jgi:hypothetical protein
MEEVVGGFDVFRKGRKRLGFEKVTFDQGELITPFGKVPNRESPSVADHGGYPMARLEECGDQSQSDIAVCSSNEKMHRTDPVMG